MLIDFVPTTEFFVGIDSDGCAMDAMDIKHQECFTPCYIKHWNLQPISTLARETALFVNLHSVTRGLNRWLALKQLLDLLRDRAEVAERGVTIPEYPELAEFIAAPGYPLTDSGIAAYAADHPAATIDRAIAWGDAVNASIADMVHGCGPFPGVREAFDAMVGQVDCMTVSATPLRANLAELVMPESINSFSDAARSFNELLKSTPWAVGLLAAAPKDAVGLRVGLAQEPRWKQLRALLLGLASMRVAGQLQEGEADELLEDALQHLLG